MLNDWFRIPVIDNEYQEYSVSSEQDSSNKRFSVSKTTIKKPLGAGKDYYEFDPVIFLQQENIRDGKEWEHPDTKESLESQDDNNYHKASEYGLKNRLLFVVNNRTVKGNPVDVSQIKGGYGVYELPVLISICAAGYAIYIVTSLCDTPVVYLARRIKERTP